MWRHVHGIIHQLSVYNEKELMKDPGTELLIILLQPRAATSS